MLIFTADIHGEWHKLYESLPEGTEAVFVCGDAEPIRTKEDLEFIPAPKKYLKLGDFYLFWEKKEVPVPTYVLLGNHEPHFWLWEYEKHGPIEVFRNFWVLARSGVIELCSVKIAYLSRVFLPKTYFEGYRWNPEKDRRSKKSKLAGHFWPEDVKRLLKIAAKAGKVDLLALHENPNWCQDERGKEIYKILVKLIKPKVIVCGHMHHSLQENFAGIPVFCLGKHEMRVLSSEIL